MVCDVCVFHTTVFGEMKLFAVLGFLVGPFSGLNVECNSMHSVIGNYKHCDVFIFVENCRGIKVLVLYPCSKSVKSLQIFY